LTAERVIGYQIDTTPRVVIAREALGSSACRIPRRKKTAARK